MQAYEFMKANITFLLAYDQNAFSLGNVGHAISVLAGKGFEMLNETICASPRLRSSCSPNYGGEDDDFDPPAASLADKAQAWECGSNNKIIAKEFVDVVTDFCKWQSDNYDSELTAGQIALALALAGALGLGIMVGFQCMRLGGPAQTKLWIKEKASNCYAYFFGKGEHQPLVGNLEAQIEYTPR